MPADREKLGLTSAIDPKPGFRDAFESATDLTGAEMYYFQILEDDNIALEVPKGLVDRQRVWRA